MISSVDYPVPQLGFKLWGLRKPQPPWYARAAQTQIENFDPDLAGPSVACHIKFYFCISVNSNTVVLYRG